MRHFLDRAFNKRATLSEFIETLKSGNNVVTDKGFGIIEPLEYMAEEPELSAEFFSLVASAPRELAEQAAELLKQDAANGDINSLSDNQHLAKLGRMMGAELDRYTKDVAKAQPWKRIYRNSIPVLRIWRTKDDVVVGEPEERNVMSNAMPNFLSSMVIAESNTGSNRVLISLSEGRYREDGSNEPVREDFLVDLPAMLKEGFEAKLRKGCGVGEATNILQRLVKDAIPLLDSIEEMARELDRRGVLQDPTGIYYRHNYEAPRKALNPEDSPNALINIGEWA